LGVLFCFFNASRWFWYPWWISDLTHFEIKEGKGILPQAQGPTAKAGRSRFKFPVKGNLPAFLSPCVFQRNRSPIMLQQK
jgi:hypothetical protein